jgi:transcriptional regulator with XRE-family HTH domain
MTAISKILEAEKSRLGLTQTDFAAFVGVNPARISMWLSGDTPGLRYWFGVAYALKMTWRDAVVAHRDTKFESERGSKIDYDDLLENGSYDVWVPAARKSAAKKSGRAYGRGVIAALSFPIRGYAAGSKDGKLIIGNDPIDFKMHPPELIGVEGAYGVIVSGDSMGDRYRNGFRLDVNPKTSRIRPGDGVVIQIRDRETGDKYGYVKEFVAKTKTELVVRQFNPKKEIRFPLKDVAGIHRVVAAHEP